MEMTLPKPMPITATAIDRNVRAIPLVLDRARRVEIEEERRDHRADDAHRDEPVVLRIRRRHRRQRALKHLVHRRMQPDGGDDEADRDQPEDRRAVLDRTERRTPEENPEKECDRQRESLKRISGH
jgi:hypothetical protein